MRYDFIPQQPQRQDATDDQLRDLIWVANRLGMYDAADALRYRFFPPERAATSETRVRRPHEDDPRRGTSADEVRASEEGLRG